MLKNKNGIIIAAIASVLVIAVISVWIFNSRNSEDKSYIEAAADYEEVNKTLIGLTTSQDYTHSGTSEKAVQMIELLGQLEKAGQIAPDSIEYDKSTQIICYEYTNGAYGGVMLEDFAEGTSGVSDDSYKTTYYFDVAENEWGLENWPAIPVFDTNVFPYEEQDLKACIMYGLGRGYEGYLNLSQQEQKGWSEAHLTTDLEDDCTVSGFRTSLAGYDLVVIQEHGVIYKNNPLIMLQETIDFSNYHAKNVGLSDIAESALYLRDIQKHRIAMFLTKDNKIHPCLTPDFFNYYYGDNLLENTIVWLGCCDGYRNDTLVKAFANCGAEAVLACTETVRTAYNFLMQDAFVYMLLYGNTVEESLDFAKSVWGENDKIFAETYSDGKDNDPSEIRIYNGGNTTLVTLTEEARASMSQKKIVNNIKFDASNGGNYAVISAYGEDGNVVWEYKTPQYEPAELPRVSEIGQKDDTYYFVQDGVVIALDVQTGNIVWENNDFGGSGTGVVLGENAIYLCGYYGPDFYAISYSGQTLSRIERFDEKYYWANEIKLLGEKAAVHLYGGDEIYVDSKVFYVDLETYEVSSETDSDDIQSVNSHISSTDLLSTLVGDWTDGNEEYRFFADGTYEYNIVHFTKESVTSRNNIERGVVEVTGISTADLAPYVTSNALQTWKKLIHDPQTDTIYVGNTTHPYYWMESWVNGVVTPDVTAPALEQPTGNAYGENLIWALDNGVLTVNGIGKMANFTSVAYIPWYSQRTSIRSVSMGSGITTIGTYAFSDCSKMTSIVIPDSVKSIEEYAFWECSNLVSITMSDSLSAIKNWAFYRCNSLSDINLPYGLLSIGHEAFYECSDLESITIPSTVNKIMFNAFKGCDNLEDVYYTGSAEQWQAIDIESGNMELTGATIHFNTSMQ